MLRRVNFIKMNKRGISEIVAYAIMIAIAISLAVAVYAWLHDVIKPDPAIDCNEGTSVYLQNYSCSLNQITLNIKNNGGFDVDGVIVKISNDASSEPTIGLVPYDTSLGNPNNVVGYWQFSPVLEPGKSLLATFTNSSGPIRRISYQAFILDNVSMKKVVCGGTAQKEPITGNGC